MTFVIPFTIFMISYGLAYLLGRRFRHLIPKGKKYEVGLAWGIGIIIIFFTKYFWFPSDNNNIYDAISFGLAFGSSFAIYDKKRNRN